MATVYQLDPVARRVSACLVDFSPACVVVAD
jgi:hypothetical protein